VEGGSACYSFRAYGSVRGLLLSRSVAEGCVVSWDWLARRAGHAPGPSASRNLAMIGPLTGPPSAPPVFWVTIANAMSPS
jgi:hypothetical protein